MNFGGKPVTFLVAATLSVFALAGCGGGYSGDYYSPAELEQEAQQEPFDYEMEQQYDEWAQEAWEDDLVASCMDDQIASGYNSYQAEAYCLDNFDL